MMQEQKMPTDDGRRLTFMSRLLWLLFLPLSLVATAQPVQQLSLSDCLTYAYNNSARIQKARLEAQRGELQVKQLTADGLPQLSASGQLNYNPTRQVIFFPDFLNGRPDELTAVTVGTAWSAQGSVNLQQLAYSPSYNVAKRAALASREFYQLMVEKTAEDLMLDIAKLYYGVQMIEQQRALLSANLDQVGALIKVVQAQVDNGFGRQIELDQLLVSRFNLQTQLDDLNLVYEQQVNMLKFSMQMPLETALVLTDTLSEAYQLPELAAITPSFAGRMDFSVLDKQRQLHQLNRLRYKADNLPSLSLFANLNVLAQARTFGDFSESRSWADFSSVGLSIQVPIFDGFRRKSLVGQVDIDLLQNAQDRRLAEESFRLRYQNARLNLQSNLNKLEPLRRNRRLAEQVYQQASQRYQQGIAPITEMVNAEASMREAQANMLLALFQVKMAELELLDINGQLRQMIR